MAKTPRGVRMINENVVQKGRAFIITSEDFDDYNWEELPDGTLHVDTKTGNISVKLAGETSWSPTGLKNDGTLVISKDTQFCNEIFTITEINKDNNIFIYVNENGEQRYKTFDEEDGFLFELEKGTYLPGRNHLEVTIDDCLIRTVNNGGIKELNERKFFIPEELIVGQKIAVRYVKWSKIGNPYPRFYLNETEPEAPEYGDFWLSESELDQQEKEIITPDKVSWGDIVGKPTSLSGYGIKDPVAVVGHVHRALDITDFPKSLPALGGDADSVKGKKPGDSAGDLATINDIGYINNSVIDPNVLIAIGAVYIQNDRPAAPKDKAIWFCTNTQNPHIEVYSNYQWITM